MRTIEFYLNNPIIEHDPGVLLVKDLHHRFIASNARFEDYSGIPPRELVGLTEHDMPWKDMADIYISYENDIISGLTYNIIAPLHGIKKVTMATQTKIIFDSHGIPAGTVSTSVPCDLNILDFTQITSGAPHGYRDLTKKESLILFLILKGKTRKDISEIADISNSSYDFHVRHIKQKIGAKTTAEIIPKAQQLGIDANVSIVIKLSG